MCKVLGTATRVYGPKFALSESPVWDPLTGTWIFVDINARMAYEFMPKSSEVHPLPEVQGGEAWKHLCAVIPRKQGGFVAIGTQGIAVMNDNGHLQDGTYVQLQTDPRIRFNDVQSLNGRLFGGTIDCETFRQPIAAFGQITHEGFKILETDHIISNGLCLSPDGTLLYHIESTSNLLLKYDHDPVTGALSNRRRCLRIINGMDFFKDRDDQGAPKALGDGMAAAMYQDRFVLCIAEWGLGRIAIYDPEGKSLVGQINVPVTRPTSLAFGMDGYKTMLITSERLPHDPADNCGLFTAEVEGLTGFAPTAVDWP